MPLLARASETLCDWAPLPIGSRSATASWRTVTRNSPADRRTLRWCSIRSGSRAAIRGMGGDADRNDRRRSGPCGLIDPVGQRPMAVVLLTALVTVHLPYGFFSVKFAEVTEAGTKFGTVGYEILLLYLGGLVTLTLGRCRALSLERWLEAPGPRKGQTSMPPNGQTTPVRDREHRMKRITVERSFGWSSAKSRNTSLQDRWDIR